MNDFLSTTKLLRLAHEQAGGNISEAIGVLRSWSFDHANATNAISVLRKKVQKRPGATTYSFGGCGLVLVA